MKTFRLLSFILSLAVLMLLFKCGRDEPPIEKAIIEGTITNAFSGNPVKGVEVSITGTNESPTTGSDGKFSFRIDASDKGYTVAASHPDFIPNKKENVVAIAGDPQKADITLQPIIPIKVNLSLIDLGAANTEKTITITNTSTSEVGYTIQNNADWISIVPQNGTIVSQNAVQVKVTVDRNKLVNGDHQAELAINVPERGNVPVTVLASKLDASSGLLAADKESMDFGTQLRDHLLVLSNKGSKTLDWSLSVDVSWLGSNKTTGSIAPNQTEPLTIFASRGGLVNDTYSGHLSFSGTGGPLTIPVKMTVTDGGENQALLVLNKTSMDLGSEQASGPVTVSNTGNRTLNWTFSSSETWLTGSATSGSLTANTSQDINLEVNRQGLGAGNHTALATFSGNGGTKTVTVSLNVIKVEAAVLKLNTIALDFGEKQEKMAITLQNTGNIALNWTAASNKPWLTLSNPSGTIQPNVATDIFAYVTRTGLGHGNYSGTLSFGGNGGAHTVTVNLVVPKVEAAILNVSTTTLDFGEKKDEMPITLQNTGNVALNWTVTSNQPWLTVSNSSGTTQPNVSAEVIAYVVRTGLTHGSYSGTLTLGGNGGTKAVTVSMTVPDIKEAILKLSTPTLTFGEKREELSITLQNTGNIALDWTAESDQPWLTINSAGGTLQPNITADVLVYADRTGLNNGNYSGTLTFGGNGGTHTVATTMTMADAADQDADGIADAADADDDNDGLMEIWTIDDLNNVRNDLTAKGTGKLGAPAGGFAGYELMKNLDFSNIADYTDSKLKPAMTTGEGWLPIGTSENYFATTFEGNNYVVKNLVIVRITNYLGLFGIINSLGKLQNLSVEIKYFSSEGSSDYVGALVGLVLRGQVTNCHARGSMSAYGHTGLLVGYNQGGTIDHCSATGTLTASSYSIGGLVGVNYSYYDSDGTSRITHCYADVVVKGGNGENTGGLVGYHASGDEISYSYALGKVSSANNDVGGLIGYSKGKVTSCYARGSVTTSSSEAGGLIGDMDPSSASISTCYSTGSVTGSSSIGGLVGDGNGTITSTNYWDTTTSGRTKSDGGTGLTTAELQAPTSDTGIYLTWDPEVWDFGTTTQYPALKNMPGGLEKQRK